MNSRRNFTLLVLIAITNGSIPILTGSTLFVWLKESGLNIQTIGLYSLANLPVVLSFAISALLEYGARHRIISYKYILIASLAISSSLVYILPTAIQQSHRLFIICLCLSISTTIARIILLALQKLLFNDRQLITVINVSTIGFKIGLLLGGSLALYLSQFYQWEVLYHYFAGLILVFTTSIALLAPRQLWQANYNDSSTSLLHQFSAPFVSLFKLPFVWSIILLMFFYRAPDNLITHYFDLFYLHFGLSKTNVAFGYKLYGMLTASLGGILCIRLIRGRSYIHNLQIALALHLFSYVLIYGFTFWHAPLWAFYLCVTCEEFSRGMTMIMFWSFQTHICTRQHVLIQLAILTAIDSLSYSLLSATAGAIIARFDYNYFILIIVLSFIPAFMILSRLKNSEYNVIYQAAK